MENKPQLNKPTVLQQNNTPTEINLPGDHNTLIAHADNVAYNSDHESHAGDAARLRDISNTKP